MEKKKTSAWIWVGIAVVAVLAVAFVVVRSSRARIREAKEFVPTEDVRPAYEAMEKAVMADSLGRDSAGYDLEETVRVITALEVAQKQDKNFDELLDCMARQDYGRVAPEVLRAKVALIPIIQEMKGLQDQYDKLSGLWPVFSDLAEGVLSDTAAGKLPGLSVGLPMATVKTTVKDGFDTYVKKNRLKGTVAVRLKEVKDEYVAYLSEFAPIYYKYMGEWDKLCLHKDKAYLDVYAGNYLTALSEAQKVQAVSPQNREGMLLEALSLIGLGGPDGAGSDGSAQLGLEVPSARLVPSAVGGNPAVGEISAVGGGTFRNRDSIVIDNQCYAKALALNEEYISLYPGKSAPALLMEGVIYLRSGYTDLAMSYLDQAAAEYPRQAAELKDLLNAYLNRTYLGASVEGAYLLDLYKSTMEGGGLFSPNLQKAMYYQSIGDAVRCKDGILKHFFRSGNQGVYDCLLSDMTFCERNLKAGFDLIEPQDSLVSVKCSEGKWLGFFTNDKELNVSLVNDSGVKLDNVRVFLCIHYTDMYRDDYDVVKIPETKNAVAGHSVAAFAPVKLEYRGKSFKDITGTRAIVMTDDKVFWAATTSGGAS
jgi:tetratricopeptide (TPR) repeat protein